MQNRQGTHLDLPPAICRPGLIYEVLKVLTIVVENSLGIPTKLILQPWVMQQTSYPIPAFDTPQWKDDVFAFIRRPDISMLELEYNNKYIRYIQQAYNHKRHTP
jgi:hypothetical protein